MNGRDLERAVAAGKRTFSMPGASHAFVSRNHVSISPGRASGLNLSKFAFGWIGLGATAGTVRINRGVVMGFNNLVRLDAATVAVGGNEAAPHYIIASGNFNPLSGAIAVNSVLASAFTGHTTNQWRVPLYECYLKGGAPFMSLIVHVGVIDLKSWMGP